MLDVGLCAQIACIWEATARKPGNVHRYRDFADSSYTDFLLSAAAIAPVMTSACQRRVGATILDAVRATQCVTGTNTNLGIVLLLSPLAAVPPEEELRGGVERVLAGLDVEDARLAYEAIRLAAPGGLGSAPEQDVREQPTQTLRQVMALAAHRDLVARQYANGFADVFEDGVPALLSGLERIGSIEGAVIFAHLQLMAHHPDTLIARKRGPAETQEAARRAKSVLETGWAELNQFDAWLRAEGHARNPGATADLLTACLFVLLRENKTEMPPRFTWAEEFDDGIWRQKGQE
ncbi:MAG TPA: triphosphoribosyl-dephospho-CoA synthase [Gemmataceae bacterium]|nr:triphosphoribosyl-dephospho-CoA synthase [Gemmataceae bacterium]